MISALLAGVSVLRIACASVANLDMPVMSGMWG